ncbi:MAG TPA: helix-turn-helix domain-containing protein [Conexibacter sp.]|jgi:DNA-binding HxlR family transcriptional regulator
MPKPLGPESNCSIARSLDLLGEKWTLLIVREAFWGNTRFSEFREELGIAADVLTERLAKLVDAGVMERREYREDGARARHEYVLTATGRQLHFVIAGLAQWGRENRPRSYGTSPVYVDVDTGERARLAFVTDDGRRIDPALLGVRQVRDHA